MPQSSDLGPGTAGVKQPWPRACKPKRVRRRDEEQGVRGRERSVSSSIDQLNKIPCYIHSYRPPPPHPLLTPFALLPCRSRRHLLGQRKVNRVHPGRLIRLPIPPVPVHVRAAPCPLPAGTVHVPRLGGALGLALIVIHCTCSRALTDTLTRVTSECRQDCVVVDWSAS